jgi:DNA replicative helicase MCM subunit Mcm2 (Cdc46/Mcm family)
MRTKPDQLGTTRKVVDVSEVPPDNTEHSSLSEALWRRRTKRHEDYMRAREGILNVLTETQDNSATIDVIALAAQKTGVPEPEVQHVLYAMEQAQEIVYQNGRFVVNTATGGGGLST